MSSKQACLLRSNYSMRLLVNRSPQEEQGTALRATRLSKDFKQADGSTTLVLDEATLGVCPGELVGLVGESGSGKTTLLNILGCIDSVSRGELEIGGVCVGNASSSRRRIIRRDRVGIVHQSFALLPTLTASENVMIPLHLQGKPRLEASLRVQSVLEQVDMLEKADMFPRHLSGGQLQRVAIARSIVHSPMVVLADEPTGNLDSRNSVAIMKLLRAIAETGCAIVCATHDQEVVSRCDRVLQTKTGASRATRFALG